MGKTIAAIATAPGIGGISVIRISGDDAISIADSVFTANLISVPSHTVHYGFIVKDGEYIDEVLVSVMRAPKTFTREDVVEISTHGGFSVTNRVLEAIISAGAVHAEAGEFTKRAFLNGRIDLSKAEAVIDIINSENKMAEQNAVCQLRGALSSSIDDIRNSLVELAAHMQVSIDYPDEDLEELTLDDIIQHLISAEDKIQKLINTADDGRIIKDGIRTVIVGKPNVGKSTLMNRLSGFEKAIVTDVAGTTRDVIEENIQISGLPIKLIDTAGIHETVDTVEKIGVDRSLKSIDGADLVIVMINGEEAPDDDDYEIIQRASGKKVIVVANRCDCGINHTAQELSDVVISAKTGTGIEELTNKIKQLYNLGEISSKRGEIITNMRHKTALMKAKDAAKRAIEALEAGMPQDMASIDLNLAIEALGEITGATVSEDIVAAVFKNFCVGK